MLRAANKQIRLFFSILLFLLTTRSLYAILHIDTSYVGKYRNNPGYMKILTELPYVYQEAFQKIQKSLGIPIREQMNVVVIFSDCLMYKGYRLRGKRQTVMTKAKSVVHYIHLDLDFLINGQATLLEELTHEMTHAVMADVMGMREYDRLPMWMKEGTAVHAADQGLARIKALTKRGFDINNIGNEDENIEGNPISLEKYVENYLKIRFLLKSFGSNAFQRFIKRVTKSGNVAKELSVSFNGLTEEVMNQYTASFIKNTLIDNIRTIGSKENLLRGMQYFDEGEFLSARLALTDALYGGLNDSDFQKAAFLLAECFIQERNPEGALHLLKKIKPDPRNVPVDRYEYLSAYTEYAMGLLTKSYFGFKKAFETSGNQAVKEGSLYYAVRILSELGNKQEAIRTLAMMQHLFPNSSYLPLVRRVIAAP